MNTIDRMKQNFIFAVIRGKEQQAAVEIARGAIAGGIKNIEITFSTPDAELAIQQLVAEVEDSNVVIGAGTVVTIDQAAKALQNGAEFLVSPDLNEEIAVFAKEKQIPYFPGCGTVTEVVKAVNLGAEIVKLFPGGVLGPAFIKDIHGPFPDFQLMPSGGVSIDNLKDWIEKGACALGVGSALTKDVVGGDYTSVEKISRMFTEKLAEIKKTN